MLRDLGLHACLAVPYPAADGPLGAVVLGWPAPRRPDPADQLTVTTIAGYAAQALARARLLAHRNSVAQQLQHAMLTTLPDVPGLTMSARYQPADPREHVGGDWYDALPVPDPDHPDGRLIALSVGDIIGHALHAATLMGQVRSMLRQAAWSHPDQSPSRILRAFERATLGLGLQAAGTALLAHLSLRRRRPLGPDLDQRRAPAADPAPPGRRAELLDDHDILFGFAALATCPAATTSATSPRASRCSSTPTAWSNAAAATSTPAPTGSCGCSPDRDLAPRSWSTSPSTPWRPTPPTTSSPSPSTFPRRYPE